MKNYKIALVEAGLPSTHVFSRVYLPRLGIPLLGTLLSNLGYDCDVYFQSMSHVDENIFNKYDLVGIGSLSNTIKSAYKLADSIKGNGTKVVMGGPHVTFMADEALNHCDYVVMGEGDTTFPVLVEALAKNESTDDLLGLAFKLPGGEIETTGRAEQVNYESLPNIDFTLSPQVNRNNIPPILSTSRGCPHDCTFCSVTANFGRKYRYRTNEQIVSELRPVLKRSVFFGDDNFCANPGRTKSLLRYMLANNAVPLRWASEMTVGAANDEELLDLMQETKCRIMYIGMESIIPETLKELGKAHEMEAIGQCIEKLHKRNIGVHGMFMVGLNDPINTIKHIVDFSIKWDIDTIQLMALTPFPGTKAYFELGERLLHKNWEYYDGMHVVFEPTQCSAYDMQMAIIEGYKRFYSFKNVVTSYKRHRGWRVKYRMGGYHITRKWAGENKAYLEQLKSGHFH